MASTGIHADPLQIRCKISGKSWDGFGLPDQPGAVPTSCARWRRADRAGPNVLRTTPIENGLRCQSNSRLDHCRRHPSVPATASSAVSPVVDSTGHSCDSRRAALFRGRRGAIHDGSEDVRKRLRARPAQAGPSATERRTDYGAGRQPFELADPGGSVSQAGSSGWTPGPRPSAEGPQAPARLRLKSRPLPSQAPAGFVPAWRSRQSSR